MSVKSILWDGLRQAKHGCFLVRKRWRSFIYRSATRLSKPYERWRPYTFDATRYRRNFLTRNAPPSTGSPEDAPRRVFVLWTGTNELSSARARNLQVLRDVIGTQVELITPSALSHWVVPEYPLHPAYEHLSLVHRSDYLRAYLLHHHGGGYCDLKQPRAPWVDAFDSLNADPESWLVGYPEVSAGAAVRLRGPLGFDIAMYHRKLVGNGAMIARPRTQLTAEWLREVERRLDYFAPHLAEKPGGIRDEIEGYPISWTQILGSIFQPLQLKYLHHVRQSESMCLDFSDYQ